MVLLLENSNHSDPLTNAILLAYAIYFDHRRRTDPNFRKQLKRESRRQARAVKEEAEAYIIRQREAIKAAVAEAKEEGFPADVEEKEAYFMNEVARGEQLSLDGMSSTAFNIFLLCHQMTCTIQFTFKVSDCGKLFFDSAMVDSLLVSYYWNPNRPIV